MIRSPRNTYKHLLTYENDIEINRPDKKIDLKKINKFAFKAKVESTSNAKQQC